MVTKNFRISVGGIPGSGKTMICKELSKNLGFKVVFLDSWYRGKKELDELEIKSWDYPEAYNRESMEEAFSEANDSGILKSPVYSKKVESVVGYTETSLDGPIVFDRVYAIRDKETLKSDFSIYLDVNPARALIRKIKRDKEYGYNIWWTVKEWIRYTQPLSRKYTIPTKKDADIVIDNNKSAEDAINDCIKAVKTVYGESE